MVKELGAQGTLVWQICMGGCWLDLWNVQEYNSLQTQSQKPLSGELRDNPLVYAEARGLSSAPRHFMLLLSCLPETSLREGCLC